MIGRVKHKNRRKHLVIFQPSGRRGYIDEGETIMEASQKLGVDLESVCGGKATCGKCKVRIEEGSLKKYSIDSRREHLSPMEESEKKFITKHQKLDGYRLACVARIYGDVLVFVPEESRTVKQIVCKPATKRVFDLKPAVRKCYVELVPATLDDPEADWERLKAELAKRFGLRNLTIDYKVLLGLQEAIRRGDWKITSSVWMDGEVIKVEPGFRESGYGVAVDIGTTTVATYLCDLSTGEVVATESAMNSQVLYGEDIMSRISYAMTNKNGLKTLNQVLVKQLNQIVREAAVKSGIKLGDILDMAVVGNTCMHHLFVGINPEYLGRAPFSPSVHHSLDVKARDLGLNIAKGAYAHVLPIEAGFVGADNVGVIIAEEPYKQDKLVLIIDIGTNGELVLGNQDKLICSSCATGPAFEGANIKYGTRAAPGAIDRVEIDPDSKEVRLKVIGKTGWHTSLDTPGANGICGSGIFDAIAQMFLAGVLQDSGRFNLDLKTPRLRTTEGQPEFVIAWANQTSTGHDITVNQADVRAVQLAKAAMYAGAKLMMHRLGVKKLDKVILAGAFGSYIDKKSAMIIGLFPDCALENVYAVGNAAGDGARIALLNVDKRKEANEVARKVQYVELTTDADFEKQFVQAMYFPHMVDLFPHLKQL
jgi:uncharacterized 2Fe-2S/4Fe-4S cluster protein (DUF4445 family)